MHLFGFKALLPYINQLLKNASMFLVIMFLFIYHVVLNMDMKCGCLRENHTAECVIYMLCPFIILFFIICMLNASFKKRLWIRSRYRKYHIPVVLLNAVVTAALWIAGILLDGDWFICCSNIFSKENLTLPCKNPEDLSVVEIAIISDIKNQSLKWGLIVTIILIGVQSMGTIFLSCFESRGCTSDISDSRYRMMYETILLNETETQVKKMFEDAAKKNASEWIETLKKSRPLNWNEIAKFSNVTSDVYFPSLGIEEDKKEENEEENEEGTALNTLNK